ncbi:ABC transporter permease [Streptomyces johnsoniae]|uniref:Transport permease protein n=1 Tax=Streptomyces johnsoniae TaxID=3075532 RepID=A0ABU2S844_9ACTN|nr:ABC transporter permease [Streptomyces sp. DSM 41886]MDT0445105.1 ABC transporter permease [Streptomyces sp. DSM 41886]
MSTHNAQKPLKPMTSFLTWGLPDAAALRRMGALARAELTLLLRNRSALFVSLLMPAALIGLSYTASDQLDLAGTGLSRGEAVMTGGIGMVLIMVLYLGLIPTYVARREERVLKRLRTGELTDGEIMTATALPAAVLALVQCVLLVVGGIAVLDAAVPENAAVLLLGLLLGTAVLAAASAATATFTKTVESAQITGMPLLMISVMGSGLYFPLDILPDNLAEICRFLPLTPAVDLVRAGWLGGIDASDQLRAMAVGVAWIAASVFAVRRWFRWEPRH